MGHPNGADEVCPPPAQQLLRRSGADSHLSQWASGRADNHQPKWLSVRFRLEPSPRNLCGAGSPTIGGVGLFGPGARKLWGGAPQGPPQFEGSFFDPSFVCSAWTLNQGPAEFVFCDSEGTFCVPPMSCHFLNGILWGVQF